MNPALQELILGILACGVIFQVTLIWLAPSKLLYTTGLWIGIAASVFKAVHMCNHIEEAMEIGVDAEKHLRNASLFRMALSIAVVFMTHLLKIGNVIAVFLGLFAMKFGAYLQPLTHRAVQKIKEKGR